MPTDPLTGSRYPSSSAAPNVAADIQNAVMDLADNTIPRFSTTAARDTAYANWVTAGGVMASGLTCAVGDMLYTYSTASSSWLENGPRLPTCRVYRSASTSYGAGVWINVPFNSLDATHTYNPGNGYFTPQLGNTERRVQVTKAGLYLVHMEHSAATGTVSQVRIGKMATANTMTTVLANMDGWACSVQVRLAAGEYLGAAVQYGIAGTDGVDSSSGGRNNLMITRLSS